MKTLTLQGTQEQFEYLYKNIGIEDKDKNLIPQEVNTSVIVGYIMYYDMLGDKINGSFFSKIDKAMEIAESFVLTFSAEENEGWVNSDFEETLEQFVKDNLFNSAK